MGKKNSESNLPDNPSLSYTLPHLITKVELEATDYHEDSWEPLNEEGFFKLHLAPKENSRFLKHFNFIKETFGIEQNFIIRSANNFPENCGLASSASSFAALTKCSVEAFSELSGKAEMSLNELASLSRAGSGSSCRSFVSPWCVWSEDQVSEIAFPQKNLLHMVVVSDGERKKVSSSLAHQKVSSSLLYSGREERARIRLGLLVEAMTSNNWKNAFELCWSEFWDMHALFETAQPSFGYMNENSLKILHLAKSSWRKIDDGPLITMDAGPNVHLLFRREQVSMAQDLKETYLNHGFQVFSDRV
jgi:diphosphomevalonate decarboxylase